MAVEDVGSALALACHSLTSSTKEVFFFCVNSSSQQLMVEFMMSSNIEEAGVSDKSK
jgi:hypothetical protein